MLYTSEPTGGLTRLGIEGNLYTTLNIYALLVRVKTVTK